MARIIDLFNLQKVDYNTGKVRQRFNKIQKALNGNDAMNTAKQKYGSCKTKLAEWETQRKNLELETQSLTERINDTDTQLMSGTISNHKELESLQASLESLKRQKETTETNLVEALEKIETFMTQLEKIREDFQGLKSAWEEKAKTLQKEGKELQKQFRLLKQKRESLTETLDKSSLTLYEQLRKRKGGVAIAPLQGDTCGACNMQVPSGIISAARVADTEPVYCPSCGRILFGNN